MIDKHYLYRHITKESEARVFYIGIGTKRKDQPASIRDEFERAFSEHNRNRFWHNVRDKHGLEVNILFESNNYRVVKEKECEFITMYGRRDLGNGTLVNLTNGGDGQIGLIFTDSHKKNLSESRKGSNSGEDHHFYGKKRRKSVRERISKSLKGRSLSDNTKEKISISNRGRNAVGSQKKSKEVVQLGNDGKVIKTWSSISEASRKLGIPTTNICKVCNGNRNSAGKYNWRYK